MAKNILLTEILKRRIEENAKRIREIYGLDDVTIVPSERYTDIMDRVQESVDVSMVLAGLRTISITAEPVADEPPALPAPEGKR